MSNIKNKQKVIFKFVTIALVVIFFLSGGLIFLDLWERKNSEFSGKEFQEDVQIYKGVEYIRKKNIETFLVIGLDKYMGNIVSDSYNNDQQADFLMLYIFDDEKKEFKALHINRDTMAEINVLGVAGEKVDTVKKQIALSHTYGKGNDVSCRNTANAVSNLLLDEKVDHYISVTMDSVAIFNDLVGGVEVEVADDFTGVDSTLIKGQKVLLKGEHALNFVRSRYGMEDSTNSTRMNRQQQYINALYLKTKECVENDKNFVVDSSLKMSKYIVSDRSINQLQRVFNKILDYEFMGVEDIDGITQKGEEFMEFYPDESSVKDIVMDLYYQLK